MNVLPGGMSPALSRQADICPHISRRAGGFDSSNSPCFNSGSDASQASAASCRRAAVRALREAHWAFSASEVFAGVAVSDWPFRYAALTY
jgi:hypothetical protein